MTAMTTRNRRVLTASTVGQVAGQLGITVRTLHHYEQIGLLVPSERTAAGYRLYTNEDITRLQHVVVYRRLGFALGEIAVLLEEQAAADSDAVVGHLRRQREAVMSRLDEMGNLVMAIDLALEKEMSGDKLTKQEQKELFGDGFSDEYAEEAEPRWRPPMRHSRRRWTRACRPPARRPWTLQSSTGCTSRGGSTTSPLSSTAIWATCTSRTRGSRRTTRASGRGWRSTSATRSTRTPTEQRSQASDPRGRYAVFFTSGARHGIRLCPAPLSGAL